jgi:hypothetical protein
MSKAKIEKQARGQFAKSQTDPKSDGVANVIPTKVTGYDEATLYKSEKKAWSKPGFDIGTQPNKRG